MLLGHVAIRNFFNDYYSKVIECVARGPEMLVDRYRIRTFGVVSVFVNPAIRLLCFQFTDVLVTVFASIAPGYVNGICGPASSSLSNLEFFLSGLVGKQVGVDHVSTSLGI